MDHAWRDIDDKLPNVLLTAIGRMALWFAALENGLAHFLIDSGASDLSFEEMSLKPLRWKLDTTENLLASKAMSDHLPTETIRKLAETRHDLMHGVVFKEIWTVQQQDFTVWNPGRETAKNVSLDDLDSITKQVREIVELLPHLSYDVRNCPT